jgi:hypothetical protein
LTLCSTAPPEAISTISLVLVVKLTLDIGFKLPDVCSGDLGIDNISLGSNLGRRSSGKSDISVDGWFVNYL